MGEVLMFDAGPLGILAHPRRAEAVTSWLLSARARDDRLVVPEISDYEVRRSFLLHGLASSIARLDVLRRHLDFLPLDSETMLLAADLWAQARRLGRPTAAPAALDCDVILAAQAMRVGAVVVTDNIGHLSQFVQTREWSVPST